MADALNRELVREFVGAAHKDLEKVQELLETEPGLLHAAMNWGGEDWETALGAAAHVGRKDIALWLLSRGARLDLFAAAMLGELEVVRSVLERHPGQLHAKGPHGISLLQHALIGGGPDSPVLQYLKSLAPSFVKSEAQNVDTLGRKKGMILVENRIEVKAGMAEGVLERFRKPKTVHTFPGFVRMDVLHAKVDDETEEIRVCTVWEKEEDFHGWSNSESFQHAHAKRAEAASTSHAHGNNPIVGNRVTVYTVEATHFPANKVEA